LAVPLGDAGKTHGERAPPLGTYYDRLARWTGWAHRFGYGGGRDSLTVHRMLADPRAGGRPTATRLHDLLLDALPSPPTRAVLDAGCGLGGTMLDLAARSTATFLGLTLSETQAATGREAAAKAGLGSRIAIRVASYDSPPDGPFELAIAIESLAHSPNPAASIAAIAARLEPGGCLAIADDVPRPEAAGTRDLELFRAGWRLPALLDAAGISAALDAGGLAVLSDHDLTPELRPRPLAAIARLEALNRALRGIAPSATLRALLDSYRGGLALEQLYRHGLMSYRLVVARRPGGKRHHAATTAKPNSVYAVANTQAGAR
jgi:SAM-dependent methyltransferase